MIGCGGCAVVGVDGDEANGRKDEGGGRGTADLRRSGEGGVDDMLNGKGDPLGPEYPTT